MRRSKSLLRCASSLIAGGVFDVGLALQRWLDGWREASKYKINPTL